MNTRALRDLTVDDLAKSPIWEMVEDDKGDVLVKPVERLPVHTLRNRLVGTQLHLADGSAVWALLGNISLNHPTSTRHFMTMSMHRAGKWFDLARYHDVDYARRDEAALAKFLAKPTTQVFPIQYDINSLATGLKKALAGQVPPSVVERLDRDELIRLSLEAE
jgi:hypothetical protein